MTYEYVCKYCDERNVWDNQIFPDSNYCKICHRNQSNPDEVNWKESNLTLTYHDTSFGRRFKSK